ncbi:MAG: DUF4426 domain-containing protein [Gammaproteobacteria bacterium]|jgi:hypothetical protein|nr:DUF4426 domain-containing protein [Gammaproteobacteria bacterium]
MTTKNVSRLLPGMLFLCAFSTLVACGRQPGLPSSPTPTGGTAPPAEAAGVASKDFGDYVVHFNAISTDQLTPEVAKSYDIVRSKNRALLNVSIVKKVEGTTGQPVPGSVAALVANDTGQVKNSTLREIREGDAIYYIGDFAVSNAETLIFTVDVTPINETSRFSVRFTRTFYSE